MSGFFRQNLDQLLRKLSAVIEPAGQNGAQNTATVDRQKRLGAGKQGQVGEGAGKDATS